MSLGYCGRCVLEAEDEETAVYRYWGEDWNLPEEVRDELEPVPGSFAIAKASLEEPEVRVKTVRRKSGRKMEVEKRVAHTPDIHGHLADGEIVVDEYCGVDRRLMDSHPGGPRIALGLLHNVYERYMRDGRLPERESFIQ